MTRAGTPADTKAARFAVADTLIADGGNLARYAKATGVSAKAALYWLRKHSPERLAQLSRGGRGSLGTSRHKALVRLLLIQSVEGIRGGKARLAKALGTSQQSLHSFVVRWAPDGLDAAIADLMPEGGAHG